MTDEHLHETGDPERDPRLARLLAEEYGATQSALGGRVEAIVVAITSRPDEGRIWWAAIATWSRVVVPLGMAVAATALLVVLRSSDATLTPNHVTYPDSLGEATVVGILGTRATGQDVMAVLMPATADELLSAAVRR